jgi:hypothetical protein
MKKKWPPLLPTTFISRFEGSCGTLGKGKKNPLLSMALDQFALKIKNKK